MIGWDRLVKLIGRHTTTGRLVYGEGRLARRFVTDTARKEREVTEVIASDVQFLNEPGTTSTDLVAEECAAGSRFEDLDMPSRLHDAACHGLICVAASRPVLDRGATDPFSGAEMP